MPRSHPAYCLHRRVGKDSEWGQQGNVKVTRRQDNHKVQSCYQPSHRVRPVGKAKGVDSQLSHSGCKGRDVSSHLPFESMHEAQHRQLLLKGKLRVMWPSSFPNKDTYQWGVSS